MTDVQLDCRRLGRENPGSPTLHHSSENDNEAFIAVLEGVETLSPMV